MYDRTRAPVPRRVTQESGGWQKRSSYEYASRYIYILLLPNLPGRETTRYIYLSLSLSVSLFLSPSLPHCSLLAGFSFYSRPRRPRHAQQTSPTVRSGRHAAFVMFPRSSFDGSPLSRRPAHRGVESKDNGDHSSAPFRTSPRKAAAADL